MRTYPHIARRLVLAASLTLRLTRYCAARITAPVNSYSATSVKRLTKLPPDCVRGGWPRWRHLMGGPLVANAWKLSTTKMTRLYYKSRQDVRGSICRKTTARSTSYRRTGILLLKTKPSHGVTELGRRSRSMLSGLRWLPLRPLMTRMSCPLGQWTITWGLFKKGNVRLRRNAYRKTLFVR